MIRVNCELARVVLELQERIKILEQKVDKSTSMDLTEIKHYPIGDVKVTFSSKELKDEFKALIEKEDDGSDKDDEEWENFPNLDGYIKRRMWEMEQGVKRRRELRICENCKYYDGKDEYERCTKHDRVMWSCADSCEQFEFKEEGK